MSIKFDNKDNIIFNIKEQKHGDFLKALPDIDRKYALHGIKSVEIGNQLEKFNYEYIKINSSEFPYVYVHEKYIPVWTKYQEVIQPTIYNSESEEILNNLGYKEENLHFSLNAFEILDQFLSFCEEQDIELDFSKLSNKKIMDKICNAYSDTLYDTFVDDDFNQIIFNELIESENLTLLQ